MIHRADQQLVGDDRCRSGAVEGDCAERGHLRLDCRTALAYLLLPCLAPPRWIGGFVRHEPILLGCLMELRLPDAWEVDLTAKGAWRLA